MFVKITLTCLFGEGYLEEKVKQRTGGKDVWLPLGEVILKSMEKSVNRMFQLHLILF
jgi:hypothetical protein